MRESRYKREGRGLGREHFFTIKFMREISPTCDLSS